MEQRQQPAEDDDGPGEPGLHSLKMRIMRPLAKGEAREKSWRRNRRKGKANLSRSGRRPPWTGRSEEHTSELQSRGHIVCRLLREKENAAKCKTGPMSWVDGGGARYKTAI